MVATIFSSLAFLSSSASMANLSRLVQVKKSVEKQCLEDPIINKYLFEFICLKLRRELRNMVSDSTNSLLRSKSAEDMKLFSWSRVLDELTQHAPMLLFILHACVKTKTVKKDTTSIIGACAVILCFKKSF